MTEAQSIPLLTDYELGTELIVTARLPVEELRIIQRGMDTRVRMADVSELSIREVPAPAVVWNPWAGLKSMSGGLRAELDVERLRVESMQEEIDALRSELSAAYGEEGLS